MTALFSGFVLIDGNLVLNAAVMVVSLASIMIVTDLSWLFIGALLTRFFPRAQVEPADQCVISSAAGWLSGLNAAGLISVSQLTGGIRP
jgi:hypothetical protein